MVRERSGKVMGMRIAISCAPTAGPTPGGFPFRGDLMRSDWTRLALPALLGACQTADLSSDTDTGPGVDTDEVVENRPPGRATLSLDPVMAIVGEDLRCVIVEEAVDPDGDEVIHEVWWTVDGRDTLIEGDTVPGEELVADETWTCHVVADDGEAEGPEVRIGTIITQPNRAPLPPLVAVSPSRAKQTDDLGCEVIEDSWDDDGDAVSYEVAWYVDGRTTGHTDWTVAGTETAPGETWTCRVTPFDGQLHGEPGEASVPVDGRMTVCVFEVTDPSADTSAACSFTVPSDGVLRLTMDNPDASLDGDFVFDSPRHYAHLFTGSKDYAYHASATAGWSAWDALVNVTGGEVVEATMRYDAGHGTENTGTDTFTATFEPGPQLSVTDATPILDLTVPAGSRGQQSAMAVVPPGDRLLVHTTQCGGGGGAISLYSGEATATVGIASIFSHAAQCQTGLVSYPAPEGHAHWRLEHEDIYWPDNTGNRQTALYHYTP